MKTPMKNAVKNTADNAVEVNGKAEIKLGSSRCEQQ